MSAEPSIEELQQRLTALRERRRAAEHTAARAQGLHRSLESVRRERRLRTNRELDRQRARGELLRARVHAAREEADSIAAHMTALEAWGKANSDNPDGDSATARQLDPMLLGLDPLRNVLRELAERRSVTDQIGS